MDKAHHYETTVTWTGNNGTGTSDYKAYERQHEIAVAGKPIIPGSSDPAFRGDKTRYNPEDMLVGALSACHMLWYLHQCAVNNVVVVEYVDNAKGVMIEDENGGHFTEVTLHPKVVVSDEEMIAKANMLHHEAHRLCYISNSVNFPVNIQSEVTAKK